MANENPVSGNLGGAVFKKERSSNLELYRIVCMLLIVAHHYVTSSGVASSGGPILSSPSSASSIFLSLFGAWGKTGINCFLMITGYYMCTSRISLRKFIKLLMQIYFYNISIYFILLITGYETFTIKSILKPLLPIWGFNENFVSCFMAFWLTIPFLSILVRNMNKRQHELLLFLLLGCYTLLGSIPSFDVRFNYITWFCILFLLASYIRLYPRRIYEKKKLWGWLLLVSMVLAMSSVVVLLNIMGNEGTYKLRCFFVSDCNKIFAVTIAVSSFMLFKNLKIPQNKLINAIGGSTFGVLLIHANSDAIRQWLWIDTIDVIGHFSLPLWQLICYSIAAVLIVFVLCSFIDQLRMQLLEKPFFKWYERRVDNKLNSIISRYV